LRGLSQFIPQAGRRRYVKDSFVTAISSVYLGFECISKENA
jgi:hypothetical protein